MSKPTHATQLVADLATGQHNAAEQLLPLVYTQLHTIAEGYMQRERKNHLLQPTALIHEAYVRLVDDSQVNWRGRTHFLGVAAKAMHRVLIDHARSRDRQKRGGKNWRQIALDDAFSLSPHHELNVLEVHDALARMRHVDARQADIAELKLFAEMNDDHIADLLNISTRTVERDWKMARAWLRRELSARVS